LIFAVFEIINNVILIQFGLFLFKFGCHDNSLFSLENLDNIFEFADPEKRITGADPWGFVGFGRTPPQRQRIFEAVLLGRGLYLVR